MLFCPSCGSPLNADSKFCPGCGQATAPSAPEQSLLVEASPSVAAPPAAPEPSFAPPPVYQPPVTPPPPPQEHTSPASATVTKSLFIVVSINSTPKAQKGNTYEFIENGNSFSRVPTASINASTFGVSSSTSSSLE